jgi:hypothetical protein
MNCHLWQTKSRYTHSFLSDCPEALGPKVLYGKSYNLRDWRGKLDGS